MSTYYDLIIKEYIRALTVAAQISSFAFEATSKVQTLNITLLQLQYGIVYEFFATVR